MQPRDLSVNAWFRQLSVGNRSILASHCAAYVTTWFKSAGLDKYAARCIFLARAADTACLAAYLPWSRARRCCGLSFIGPHVRHSWLDWLAPLVFRNASSAGYVPVLRSINPLNDPSDGQRV